MNKFLLEACVDSVSSALAAVRGGADRLELCGNLIIGGTTPDIALYKEIRKYSDIPIRVLLRPRFGDFCYTDYEHEIIKEEVKLFRELGADGVVIGTLKQDGSLNMDQMRELVSEAGEMSITLHRAFDMCEDPMKTLENVKELGIHTILTSGQKNSCINGTELLSELVRKAEKKVDILIGGGVDASVIEELYDKTGATSYHMSGKITLDSEMQYRKEDVSMGVASMSEYEIWRTSSLRVSAAKKVLDKIRDEK
jgi:copper homeostasis protein